MDYGTRDIARTAREAHPSTEPASQVASTLFTFLAGLAGLTAVIGFPFFARPLITSACCAVIAATALFGKRMVRRRRTVLAMHGYAVVTSLIAFPVMATAATMTTATLLIVMMLPAYAVVCGRSWALGLGASYIAAAIGVLLARQAGWEIPIIFPTPPAAIIVIAAATIVAVVVPFPMVFSRLREALTSAEVELDRRRDAERELAEHRAGLERMVTQRTAELLAANQHLTATQFALDSVGTSVTWVDVASGRFVSANEAAGAMLGYTREELLQLSVSQVDAALTPELYERAARDVRKNGHLRFEAEHRRKDGSLVPVEMTVYYLAGTPDRFVAFGVDISARKAAEEDLRRAKLAAEEASDAKSRFLANISHELRTPLNAIIGMTHLLKRTDPTPLQAERLEAIVSAGQHLLEIVNSVLDISRIEAGKLQLVDAEVGLAKIVDHVGGMLSEQLRSKGLQLRIDLDPLPPGLRGDATRIQQALLNYAVNAIKFTERGSVTLRCRKETELADHVRVRFEVEDTGIGIAPGAMARLFSAFEQVDNSLTREHGGAGLGLAITKRLAQLMGGDAGAESTPGVGSTFWFTICLAKATPVAEPGDTEQRKSAEAMLRHRHASKRVLVVEDDPVSAALMVDLVKLVGLTVETAGNGEQALERARERRYDLVLIDMQMPRMDGLEATRRLRQLPAWADVPIVALTANVFTQQREACMAAGMNGFLGKPVDPHLLYKELLHTMERRDEAVQPAPGTPHVAAPESAPNADQGLDLPGIDVKRGTKTWRHVSAFAASLRLFATEYASVVQRLEQLPRSEAIRLAHKLKGSAGTVALSDVAVCAAQLERALQDDRDRVAAADALRTALDIALESIDRFEAVVRDCTERA